jgi:hypothetical protein
LHGGAASAAPPIFRYVSYAPRSAAFVQRRPLELPLLDAQLAPELRFVTANILEKAASSRRMNTSMESPRGLVGERRSSTTAYTSTGETLQRLESARGRLTIPDAVFSESGRMPMVRRAHLV